MPSVRSLGTTQLDNPVEMEDPAVWLLICAEHSSRSEVVIVVLVEMRADGAQRKSLERSGDAKAADAGDGDADGDSQVDVEVGGANRRRRLSESQIRALPVAVRLKICRGAARDVRNIMIRDPNPTVAVAVLEFNSLADSEVEGIAGNKNLASEVLAGIVSDRHWPQRHAIALALVKNPKVQVGAAVRLLNGLSVRELGRIGLDRSVAEGVRKQARRLYRIKVR